jgi:L-threonylcarbamoyladenylate synthase
MFPFKEDIEASLKVLEQGGLILYPTDTVWGIGCDATNEQAVQRIFELKKRSDTKAMIILVDNETSILNYVEINELQIFDYIKGIHKPTTVIYQQAKNLAHNLLANDSSVAIRICKDKFCQELIKQFGKPIVSTSANVSTSPTPLCFNDISLDIIEGVDYVVKYRQDDMELQQPSSVVKWDKSGNLTIIRH